MHVIEIDDASFDAEVIRRSFETPVLVDFWAPWCGPCKVLGPVLEALAEEANGEWVLVKIDTEKNPLKAAEYKIQGIPNVKAFVDGRLVDEFSGALPRPMIEQWIKRVLPGPLDRLVNAATGHMHDGELVRARERFEEVLRQNERHLPAMVGLAETAIGECLDGKPGSFEEAERILNSITDVEEAQVAEGYARVWTLIEGYREVMALRKDSDESTDVRKDLRAALSKDPKNPDLLWGVAMVEAAAGDKEQALIHLIEIVKVNRAYRDDGARKAMIRIFRILGEDHPLTHRYRQELGRWLY